MTALAQLLQDFEVSALAHLRRCGAQDGPHGLDRASLLADDLAEIFFGDAEFEHDGLLARDLRDLDFVRLVDQCTREELDEFFEGN
jgi:hypothetical protein